MQFFDLVIELAIELPRATAAKAMADPTIARISAYSAAEAPDSSRSILMKLFIVTSLPFRMSPRPFARPASQIFGNGNDTPRIGQSGSNPLIWHGLLKPPSPLSYHLAALEITESQSV